MKYKEQEDIDSVKELMSESESYEEECEPEKKGMSDSEVLSYCQNEVSRGIGGSSSNNASRNEISLAYDLYFGRRPGLSKAKARDPHASRFVSLDIQDAVESTLAEIMPTFMADDLAFYTPEDERDEEAAQKESDIANYIFAHECDGYSILQASLRDCLLNRNGLGKVYWEKRKDVRYEVYENVTQMVMDKLLGEQPKGEAIEIVEQEEQETPFILEDGSEIEMFTVKVKRIIDTEKPVIESVATEKVVVSGDHDNPVLYDARFCAHENIVTQSYLIEIGYNEELVNQLEDYNTNTEEQSRSRENAEYDYYSDHRSVRYIRVMECYGNLDVDGDGIAELRKITYSGGTLLSNDPWDSVELIGGVTTAVAHKWKGLSLVDRLKDIQEAKTPVLRSIIEGTQLSSNPRLGVITGQANIDDIVTSRTGGYVRATQRDAIFAIPSGEVPQSSYGFLDFMDSLRRERGGSAINTASVAQDLSSSSEATVGRVMTSMELTNALLARTFAETFIKGIFVQLHAIIRENYKGEISAKIRGRWVTSTPAEWKERTGVVISVGTSNAERGRQKMAMVQVVQTQELLKNSGSVMFSEEKAYQAIVRAVSLAGIKNPEAYFIDPTSEEGMKATEGQNKQSTEMKQKEDQMMAAMAKAANDTAQAELKKGEAALISQQVKFENDQLKNQITEMKTLLDANAKTIDQEIKTDEIRTKEAIELTKLEVENNRELSKQNEDNKNVQ